MWRVLVAALKQETATFNPVRTRYDDFHVATSHEIFAAYGGTRTELAGAMEILAADGRVEIVPTFAADAVSGGPVATPDLDRLLAMMVDAIRQGGAVDGLYICFHGAMAGEEEGDPEGRVLSQIREIVGSLPIVVSLDLHAIITKRLVEAADILVPFHTYPHVDQFETGQRAARNLIRLLEGGVKPVTARVELPMLVRGDELITTPPNAGLFAEAIRMCREIEASAVGLAAGVIIGNPFTDVADLQSNVLVTSDNDPTYAQQQALKIARFMWENRQRFQATLTPVDEAIRLAQVSPGLTIFSDAADATASGASGDSNAILKALIEADFEGKALAPIVDQPAVATAFAAGVGATIHVALGGTRDPGRFEPFAVSAFVKSLHDGHFVYENGMEENAGRVAVLRVGNVSVLVTERSVYVVGRRVFQAFGLEPADFGVVVVKSPNGFRPYYQSIASRIVAVDVPGSTSANLKSLPYCNCIRPIFPLDEHVQPPFPTG